MKTLMVVYSYHHNNTEKVANAMAEVLNADVKNLQDKLTEEMDQYDLVGFGAGIDSGRHYKPMLDFAITLPPVNGKKAFIFSTSAIYGEKKMLKDHAALRDILIGKGYKIIGEYSCAGYNTNSVLKYFGGMNRGKPNEEDLHAAKAFAASLCSQ